MQAAAPRRRGAAPALALVLATLVLPGKAGADELPAALESEREHALLPSQAVSVFVAPLETGSNSFSLNADVPMNPASTMKLVTTFAALELLGPAYTWKTAVFATAPQEGGVGGDLYIKGSGDPHLTESDLWALLREVRQRGIAEVRDIVIDRSIFAPVASDPGQFDNEPNRAYNAAPDGFLANFDATSIYFVPDPGHRSVHVFATPELAGQNIGAPRLSDEACGDWRARLGLDLSNPNRLSFTGSYAASCGEKVLNLSLYSPRDYGALLIASLWRSVGARLDGVVKDGLLPQGARLVAEHTSDPLAVALYDMNKYSNNVMARNVFLTLAAESARTPATAQGATLVVKRLLTDRGIDVSGLELENGSGLSRLERITARTMGAVLIAAWHSPTMPEFFASLPVVGLDGTMKNRLRADGVAGHAHIKTGTLADARAIAGYVDSARGRRYVVVCIVNDAQAERARGFQDALINWVFSNG
jgi:D-alanyl-D-alanine carboxypeptidase/D-alanyl-D-alanine-endopeptidase (penicillin-binding protein 4)